MRDSRELAIQCKLSSECMADLKISCLGQMYPDGIKDTIHAMQRVD